ncbi:MAG: 50S ribosomal protein L22 [Candidatus Nanohaloarchaeota archaeon QJJ-5]|nr:50S ribosomal protein L22 [Candidatus Nanohaloarchaeota archaeon QJJ-5]
MADNDTQEAKARGVNIDASQKHCTEIGGFIRGDDVSTAKEKLEKVIKKEQPVPYDKYDSDLAHKKGSGDSGRYPVNASKEVLRLLESAEQNAVYEGMDEQNLYIAEYYANQGQRMETPGRNRGRKPKSAHVTIKLRER